MHFPIARKRLEGCYITVPTMFRDPDLALDLRGDPAQRALSARARHRRALRHAARRRRRRRLLDHDLRRAPGRWPRRW